MLKPYFKQLYRKEISTISKKYKLTIDEVIEIYYIQFQLIVKKIREENKLPFDNRHSIRIQGLGKLQYSKIIAKQIQKTDGTIL